MKKNATIKIIIPGDAVSKKNSRPIHRSRRTGKSFLGKSRRLRAAERVAVDCVVDSGVEAITCDVAVSFVAYTRTLQRIDLSNMVQLYEDALQIGGVLRNDSQIRSLDGTRQRHDPRNPRVEITIVPFDNFAHG